MKDGLYHIKVTIDFDESKDISEGILIGDGGAVCVKLQPVEDYPCIPDPYEELGTAWAEFKTAMWNEFSESKPGKLFIRAADKFAAFLERRFHG